ncbi:MAG: T9SS type A sorting domain-containing protein [Saprospiraceae bacterium]|nr:T9SS type A sorting domain-containing protein [Saprospiraceae bacterium]
MKVLFTLIMSLTLGAAIAQCPDLKITNASILSDISKGIRYAINISNIGNQDANLQGATASEEDNVTIQSYLSNDQVIDAQDKRIQDVLLGVSPLTVIKPGEVFSIVNKDSVVATGYRFLIIKIDPLNKLNECAELNNVFVLELYNNQLTLETTMIEGFKGQSIEIPVYASDFYNILGFQFSMSFSNPSLFRIDSVGNLGLNDLNRNDIQVKNDNRVGVVWFSPLQSGLSFNGRRKIFSLYVTLTGEHGQCTDIRFDDSFLTIEFISSTPLGDPIRPALIDGKVCIQNLVECSGKVILANNTPIPNTLVSANQSTALTDLSGRYLIKDLIPGINYTVSASKFDSYASGLSVMDIVLIKKHLLQIQLLPTPYQIIAADVNGDLTISVQDMVLIRDLILGFVPNFGKTPVWQFIPKDYKFKNPLNPLAENYPIAYSLPNLKSNKITLDFIGIKTGDVSLDWTGQLTPSLESRAATYFILALQDQNLMANTEYTLPVYTRQFNNISAFQFALNLNPDIQLEQVMAPALPDFTVSNYSINDHVLRTLWYDSRSNGGRFVKDNDTLLLIRFKTTKAMNAKNLFTIDPNAINPEGIHQQGWYFDIKMEIKPALTHKVIAASFIELSMYPNPVSEVLHLTLNNNVPDNLPTSIRITDQNGRTVSVQTLTPGQTQATINTSDWISGRYIITAVSGSRRISKNLLCIH